MPAMNIQHDGVMMIVLTWKKCLILTFVVNQRHSLYSNLITYIVVNYKLGCLMGIWPTSWTFWISGNHWMIASWAHLHLMSIGHQGSSTVVYSVLWYSFFIDREQYGVKLSQG